MDKIWTNFGGPTRAWSTEKFANLNSVHRNCIFTKCSFYSFCCRSPSPLFLVQLQHCSCITYQAFTDHKTRNCDKLGESGVNMTSHWLTFF